MGLDRGLGTLVMPVALSTAMTLTSTRCPTASNSLTVCVFSSCHAARGEGGEEKEEKEEERGRHGRVEAAARQRLDNGHMEVWMWGLDLGLLSSLDQGREKGSTMGMH